MTINRTTLLDLPLPVTGTESGTWGDAVNNGLTQYVDIAVAGMTSLTSSDFTAGALSLSLTDGTAAATNIVASSAQYGAIKVSGLAVASTITAPSSNRRYVIINADSTYNVTIKASGQTGVAIVPGEKALVAFNGTDYVKVGGAAGGSTTQVQYNNAGVFGGITNATTDGTTLSMTSPKVITSINDTNGNELLKVTATGSAVNEVTVANAATGNNPVLSATGNDTNIGINLTPKGSGAIKLSGLSYPTADGTSGQAITTNGSGTLSFATIASLSGQTDSASPFETALGSGAGAVTTGVNNTFIGFEAGNDNTTGTNNTAVGYQALDVNTIGTSNTAVGSAALGANTTGANNTAVGSGALSANTTGVDNTAVGGASTLNSNTTGSYNCAFSPGAMDDNTTGSYNVAIGRSALASNSTASNNIAIGYQALFLNTTGASNTAVGYQAGYSNTTSSYNAFIGYQAGYSNTTGGNNTFVGGYRTGYTNTTGDYLTGVGYEALSLNTTGQNNTAVGWRALYANTTGQSNVAFGNATLDANTTGVNNTAMGSHALTSNTTGGSNVALGGEALYFNTTGANNTAVGYGAGDSITTGTGNVILGYNADASAVGGVDQIVIGNGVTGQANTNVTIGNGAGKIYNAYTVNATWTQTSDGTMKNIVEPDTLGLSFINRLNPIKFTWKPQNELPVDHPYYKEINGKDTTTVIHGFVAQEIKAALDAEGCTTFNGWDQGPDGIQAISREMFISPLVKAVQELSAQVQALQAEVNALKGN